MVQKANRGSANESKRDQKSLMKEIEQYNKNDCMEPEEKGCLG